MGKYRWVTVSLKNQTDLELTFVVADSEEKRKALRKQRGDYIFLTLETHNCHRDIKAMKAEVIKFYRKPL